MKRALFAIAIGLAVLPAVHADTYWITYEGYDLPEIENPAWHRVWGNWDGIWQGDGAIRTVEDGILTTDSLHDPGIADYSKIDMEGQLDPAPGEVFVAEWRLKVVEVIGDYDATLAIRSDTSWGVGLNFYEDNVVSLFEDNVSAPVAPGMFHKYRLLSTDMRTYDLYIDGAHAIEGSFWDLASSSYVAWGDGVQGAASISKWDYFRFGVLPAGGLGMSGASDQVFGELLGVEPVPEPDALLGMMILLVCGGRRRAGDCGRIR